MSNPVVLRIGALTGIGGAAAVAFAKNGAKAVVAGRRNEAGKALVNEVRSFASEAEFIDANIGKEDELRTLVDKTVARFGRLDVALHTAGTEGQAGPITDRTAEKLCRNVRHECSRRDPEHERGGLAMQALGRGSLIDISSTYGHEGAAGLCLCYRGPPQAGGHTTPSSRPGVSTATAQRRSSSPAMQTSSCSIATSRRTPIYPTT